MSVFGAAMHPMVVKTAESCAMSVIPHHVRLNTVSLRLRGVDMSIKYGELTLESTEATTPSLPL
jgi:hypothetical protein